MLEGGAIRPQAAHLAPRPPVPLSPLLAVADRPPCRCPRLARPSRLGSASHRLRRSARSACAATAGAPPPDRVAAARRRHAPGPSPAAVPLPTPAACGAYPRAATNPRPRRAIHSCRARRQRHTQLHTPTGSHALPHTRQGLIQRHKDYPHPHAHIVAPLIRGHAGSEYSKYVTQSQACTRSRGETVPDSVTHCKTLNPCHHHSRGVIYEHACATPVAHFSMGSQSIIDSHITHGFTITQHHTLLHTPNLLHTPWESVHPAQSHTRYTVTGHK